MATVQKVEIKNFKGIDYAQADLEGRHVYLVAKNGGGKTSFIDAVFGHLSKIKNPLKDGEKRGEVNIVVDGYQICFTFTKKNQKPTLSIFDKEGKPQTSPATLFKKLFGVTDFDIDNFLGLSASKKVDFIKDIVGIDWTEQDARHKALYEERTFLNRKIKEQDAKLLNVPVVKDAEERDTDAIQDRFNKANEANVTHIRITRGTVEAGLKMSELRKQILLLSSELGLLEPKFSAGKEWLEKNEAPDLDKINTELKEAIEHNKSIALYTQYTKDREDGAETVAKVLKVEEEMEKIKQKKKTELEKIEMPVKGLTFDDDQLYLDGLPFESNQINTARRIVAGLEIQYQLRGEVTIARLEGSLLDKNSINEVIEWADEKGIQLFIEKVDQDGGELEIQIVEE